ncbi:MAG: hypothetical protein GY705_07835, partial [Bacteroidetes bacterium]|nr:hypothetical protein [Bacteroidota bacterium]
RLSFSKVKELFSKDKEESTGGLGEFDRNNDENLEEEEGLLDSSEPEEAFLDLFKNFNVSHSFQLRIKELNGKDTLQITTNSIRMSGNIQLTKNWSIQVGNFGYDFVRKGFSYPDFGFKRNLHCWEMGMNWQPTRSTYAFFIRVKPGSMDFLKIPYNRNSADRTNF